MADTGERSQRDRAGVGPDPEAEHARDLVPLEDMSGYAIAAGDPDIRGWNVRTQSGRDIGEIEGLLVDKDRGEVVKVDVELRDGGAHAEVPIRSVQLDREHRTVIVDSAELSRQVGSAEEFRVSEELSTRSDVRSDARELTSDPSRSAASFGARGSQRADLPGAGSRPTSTSTATGAAAAGAVAGAAAGAAGVGRRKTAVDETIRRTAAEHTRDSRSVPDAPNEPRSTEVTERSFSETTRQSMPRSSDSTKQSMPRSSESTRHSMPRTDEPQRRTSPENPRQGIPGSDESQRRTSSGSSRQSMPRTDEPGNRSQSRPDDFKERRPPGDGQ